MDPMEATPAWLDALLKSILGSAKIDLKKIDHAQLKIAIKALGESFKPTVTIIGDLDDKAIDGMVTLVDSFIDSLPTTMHPTVGAASFTMVDVMALSIPQSCKDKIALHPEVLKSLERLTPAQRIKVAGDSHLLDLLIQWGPVILKVIMTLLPFIL